MPAPVARLGPLLGGHLLGPPSPRPAARGCAARPRVRSVPDWLVFHRLLPRRWIALPPAGPPTDTPRSGPPPVASGSSCHPLRRPHSPPSVCEHRQDDGRGCLDRRSDHGSPPVVASTAGTRPWRRRRRPRPGRLALDPTASASPSGRSRSKGPSEEQRKQSEHDEQADQEDDADGSTWEQVGPRSASVVGPDLLLRPAQQPDDVCNGGRSSARASAPQGWQDAPAERRVRIRPTSSLHGFKRTTSPATRRRRD